MAVPVPDRVQETTTTTGTGTLDLGGAVTGFQTFVAAGWNGLTVRYCIGTVGSSEWEVGKGVLTDASPDTLSRVTIEASSNSGNAVNLSAGTKNVFLVQDGSLSRSLQGAQGPLWPRLPANAKSDFFDDSKGMSGNGNGLASIWTATNQGSQTIAYADNRAYITATAADSKFMLLQAIPSTPYTATLRLRPYMFATGSSNVGICFRETSSGKIHVWEFSNPAGVSTLTMDQYSGSGSGTYVATDHTFTTHVPAWDLVIRVTDNGTNLLTYFSPDGGQFYNVGSVGRTSYLGAVNTFGILHNGVSVAHTNAVGPWIVS